MQSYSNPKAGRMPSTNGINSKVSAPAGAMGKSMGNMPDSPLSSGSPTKSIKGFGGGSKSLGNTPDSVQGNGPKSTPKGFGGAVINGKV